MKMSKQFRIVAAILVGGIVVASSACSVDGIAPTSTESTLAPTTPTLAVASQASGSATAATGTDSGLLPDGTYSFVIDPRIDQVVVLGQSRVVLPASSVCALGVSGYGPTLWDRGCNPQKKPFTLIVTVAGSGTDYAALDFQPAMRFDPTKTVTMSLYVASLKTNSTYNWKIFYCPTPDGRPGQRLGTNLMRADPTCVDESLTDASLKVVPDYTNSVLVRRLKHFSAYQADNQGYMVGE
jgi:hypothetical protein